MVHLQLYQDPLQDLCLHLTGGGGSSGTGGGVQGPLRSNTAGTPGSATVSSSVSNTGQYLETQMVLQKM